MEFRHMQNALNNSIMKCDFQIIDLSVQGHGLFNYSNPCFKCYFNK